MIIPNGSDVKKVEQVQLARSHESSKTQEKRGTYITRLVMTLEECLAKLGVNTTTHVDLLALIERMACLIHESMSVSSRNYHSVQHVFDVAENLIIDEPIAVIAALFHDCVYYHVDGGLSDLQYEKLKGAVTRAAGAANGVSGCGCLQNTPICEAHKTTHCADDTLLCMVEKIFGYSVGQAVNHTNGLNEFLSAIIAVRELAPVLPRPTLAKIACCLEATIPFRPVDTKTGESCMDKLFDKMTKVNVDFSLGFSQEEVVTCVQRAADLSGADVLNFGTGDVFWFLDNTWSLLPESNEGLRRSHLYTVQQFQFAVFKMYGFFCFLQPEVIYPFYQNFPAPETIQERVGHASNNLHVGRSYVGAKLLSLSILSAVAELTGGDAPISLFMGDLPSRHTSIASPIGQTGKHDKLSSLTGPAGLMGVDLVDEGEEDFSDIKYNKDVYEVLSKGRRTESSFDVRQSPLAASFYRALGDADLKQIFVDMKVYPMTADVAWALLRRLPEKIVGDVIQNLSYTAISRTDKILQVLKSL
eukprot:CAMPEP_0198140930 /NCGR_PEP_ID=MMETSP1443-20131203/4013_1 /TAXON_ID=186043 /ORGANISM="Entomoneis sp., Strain CCMP2396" /LENGTH=528 /DNA_ID=CAMNT_0043803509 /DNA_START=64 /DNA_END=1650 /DNA_ORIENTATION=-